jgi:uncharacterized membrane protein YgdD (TMEM256/DUF423 family)
MTRNISAIAAFLGMLAILLGAFGAHALKDRLDPESLQSFETGVRYMMYHVLALLLINNNNLVTDRSKRYISLFFLIGILCFSGSIFVIALDLISAKTIWFVTPFGGLLFIIGWLITGFSFLRSGKDLS